MKLQKKAYKLKAKKSIKSDWLEIGFRHLASKIHRRMDTRHAKGITVPKLFKFLMINK